MMDLTQETVAQTLKLDPGKASKILSLVDQLTEPEQASDSPPGNTTYTDDCCCCAVELCIKDVKSFVRKPTVSIEFDTQGKAVPGRKLPAMGHTFNVVARVRYKKGERSTRCDCRLEWWEKCSPPPWYDYNPEADNQWRNAFHYVPDSKTAAAWNALLEKPDCPGGGWKVTMHDPPCMWSRWGIAEKSVVDFRIKLDSCGKKKCKCKNVQLAIEFRQELQWSGWRVLKHELDIPKPCDP